MERNHLLSLFFVQTATRQISARSLRHERYRIAEQCDPGCHKETQSVPDRRLGAEGYLSGDQGCIKKMEYADPELAAGDESFYYRVR